MQIDELLKTTQILFYAVATVTTIATYRAAKRGLLNTVHTEYQKHVIERVKELSTELASEFDPLSDTYWARNLEIQAVVHGINQDFLARRDSVLRTKEFRCGIMVPSDELRLGRLADVIRSDPFLPKEIRAQAIDLLDTRLQVLSEVRVTVAAASGRRVASVARAHHSQALGVSRRNRRRTSCWVRRRLEGSQTAKWYATRIQIARGHHTSRSLPRSSSLLRAPDYPADSGFVCLPVVIWMGLLVANAE